MTKDAVRAGSGSGLSVAGWPLRRKMALALAIPLLLAATLGGLRVANDLVESSSSSTSASQVTVVRPAVDYLSAAETAMVAAQGAGSTSQGDLIDAIDDINANADELEDVAADANLTDRQSEQVAVMLDLSQAMRGEDARALGPATWVAQVRQLESSVNQLISSLNAAQNTPEPRLEQLSQAVSGRMSLAMQQALVADDQLAQYRLPGALLRDRRRGLPPSTASRPPSATSRRSTTSAAPTPSTPRPSATHRHRPRWTRRLPALRRHHRLARCRRRPARCDAAAADARRSALIGALLTLVALAAAVLLARRHRPLAARADPAGCARARSLSPATACPTRSPRSVPARSPGRSSRSTSHQGGGRPARPGRRRPPPPGASCSRPARPSCARPARCSSRCRGATPRCQPAAGPDRAARAGRGGPQAAREPVPARPPRLADAPYGGQPADPGRRADTAPPGSSSLTVGETLQAATSGVQDYQRVQVGSPPEHPGERRTPRPTSSTCSPSWSTTRSPSPRLPSRSAWTPSSAPTGPRSP